MQANDREEFKTLLGMLCGGFNVPLTKQREEGYWAGLSRMSVGNFRRAVEFALGENYAEEELPTTGKLWRIHRGSSMPTTAPQGPAQNAAERLCEYIVGTLRPAMTARQFSQPWTYLGSPGGQITGVAIPADGDAPGFRVMLHDLDGPLSAPQDAS